MSHRPGPGSPLGRPPQLPALAPASLPADPEAQRGRTVQHDQHLLPLGVAHFGRLAEEDRSLRWKERLLGGKQGEGMLGMLPLKTDACLEARARVPHGPSQYPRLGL